MSECTHQYTPHTALTLEVPEDTVPNINQQTSPMYNTKTVIAPFLMPYCFPTALKHRSVPAFCTMPNENEILKQREFILRVSAEKTVGDDGQDGTETATAAKYK